MLDLGMAVLGASLASARWENLVLQSQPWARAVLARPLAGGQSSFARPLAMPLEKGPVSPAELRCGSAQACSKAEWCVCWVFERG
mmetsp:Transcript_51953/g.112641  ORF Transcript_51953/g.112641 Transcript_51953/m.112641 type:complete len:85 (-) Transcript_51953:1850-2104(-)